MDEFLLKLSPNGPDSVSRKVSLDASDMNGHILSNIISIDVHAGTVYRYGGINPMVVPTGQLLTVGVLERHRVGAPVNLWRYGLKIKAMNGHKITIDAMGNDGRRVVAGKLLSINFRDGTMSIAGGVNPELLHNRMLRDVTGGEE